MKKLIILGAGGHGKVCANIAKDMRKWDEIVFLDDRFSEITKVLDFGVIGNFDNLEKFKEYEFFVAIGNNKVRADYINKLENLNLSLVTLIHPSAYVSEFSEIGVGTSIHQFSVINTDSIIGRGCIINTSSVVEHENIIGDFVHLSPNVSLGGQVVVKNFTWIGIGSTIINNVSVGSNIIVGSHSLLLGDLKISGVYYGHPIKRD